MGDYGFIDKAQILIIGLVSFTDAKIEIKRNFAFHYILLYAHWYINHFSGNVSGTIWSFNNKKSQGEGASWDSPSRYKGVYSKQA